jgi:hypothetical protein
MFSTLPCFRPALLLAACLFAFPHLAHAGGGPTGVAVVYNPTDPSAVTVANYYQQVRGIPERNMIPYTFPANTSFQFASRTSGWDFVYALRSELAARGLNPQLQAIALMGVVPKLSAQSVASFNNGNAFATTSFIYLSPNYGQSTFPVSNWTQSNAAYPNDADFYGPAPAGTRAISAETVFDGKTYWPAMMLGYTGRGGLRIGEWFEIIDRAKLRDGTKPDGTIYWPLNSDVRSTTRESQISVVAPIWQARGLRYMVTGKASSANERWVQNRNDVLGGMVGQQNPTTPAGIRGGNTYLGGWIDKLTSNGGNIEWFVSQDTQMLAPKWLRAGADGASGSGYEPYAWPQKFAHGHIHTHLRAGASQAEAFWQSIKNPAEIIPFGDPLLQPWASLPTVAISAPLNNATVSGTMAINATAAATGGKTLEPNLDLFVDGRRVNIGAPGETIAATRTAGGFSLNTTTLSDGWHDVRVVAYNADSVRTQNEAKVAVNVNNAGQAIAISGPPTYNPDSTSTSFTATLSGHSGLTSLKLQSNGRTVATFPAAGGTVNVNLTATASFAPLGGSWVLYAVGTRAHGSQVSSPPFTTTPNWPANPATANPALGPYAADVKYFANTVVSGFNWDTATPEVVATIPGDTASGVALSIDAIANDADSTSDPITLGGTTYTLTYANKPGFQVDFWFYAPKDDWYEFSHDFSERVFYNTRGQSEKREFYVDGQLLTDREGLLPPRRLAPGWHSVRARFAVNAGSRFGANVNDGPSPQGWMSWKTRVRGGPNVDYQIIPPALCANTGTGVPTDVPTITSVSPTTTVTGTTRALTATASIASGALTYHWTRLSGGTHAGFHTGRAFTPRQEPQTINFSANSTTAASGTTVTFYEPGNYVLGLRVAGPNASAYTTVPLTVAATAQSALYLSYGSPPLAASGTITVSNGSPLVTMTDTTGLAVGQRVAGTGIPADTYIDALNPNTSITLNKNATANGTALTYFPLGNALPGLPFTLVACTRDQFGNRIPITPTVAGQPTVQWTSTDPTATFSLATADGENAQFISNSTSTAVQNITVTATGVNGRTGTNSTILTLRPNTAPTKSGAYLVTISQDPATKTLSFGGNVNDPDNNTALFKQSLLTYQWSILSTPPGGSLTLSANAGPNITGVASGAGTYSLRLTVTDQSGASVAEDRTFIVKANGDADWLGTLNTLLNKSIYVGETAQFTYSQFGPLPGYQWQTSGDGGATWQDLAGTIIPRVGYSDYAVTYGPASAADNGRRFRLQLINSAGTSTTNGAILTVSNSSGGVLEVGESLRGRLKSK